MTKILQTRPEGKKLEEADSFVGVPEMIFGHLLTSSNCADAMNEANMLFVMETADGKKKEIYKQVFSQRLLLENLEVELKKLDNKVRFILGVVKGEIIVINRRRVELFTELRDKGFDVFPQNGKSSDAEENEDNSELLGNKAYDYLLSMSLGSLTLEKVQELCNEKEMLHPVVAELKRATEESLLVENLNHSKAEEEASKVMKDTGMHSAKYTDRAGTSGYDVAPASSSMENMSGKAAESEFASLLGKVMLNLNDCKHELDLKDNLIQDLQKELKLSQVLSMYKSGLIGSQLNELNLETTIERLESDGEETIERLVEQLGNSLTKAYCSLVNACDEMERLKTVHFVGELDMQVRNLIVVELEEEIVKLTSEKKEILDYLGEFSDQVSGYHDLDTQLMATLVRINQD